MNLLNKSYEYVDSFPSIPTLATEIGVSSRTVDRYLKELRKYGLIRIYNAKFQGSNNYAVIPVEWVDFETTYEYCDIIIGSLEEFEELKAKIRAYVEQELVDSGFEEPLKKAKKKTKGTNSDDSLNRLDIRLEDVNKKCEDESYKLNGADCGVLFANEMRKRGLLSPLDGKVDNAKLKRTFKDIDNDTTRLLIEVFVRDYEKIVDAWSLNKHPAPSIAGICYTGLFSKLVLYVGKLEERKKHDYHSHSNRPNAEATDIVF